MRPYREGVGGARRVYGDEAAGPPLKRIQSGATLAELKQDYEMFTYAPLFIHGGLEHNPIQEWINHNDHEQIVYILQLDTPFIHIGGPSIMDKTLWLVEKQYWDSLALHIGSMAFLNRDNRQLTRVVCQNIMVPDVAASKLPLPDKRVVITTFSTDSNLGCLAFKPGTVMTQWRPQLQMHSAREETVKLAHAMLMNKENPYSGLQLPPWEKTSNENPDPSAA